MSRNRSDTQSIDVAIATTVISEKPIKVIGHESFFVGNVTYSTSATSSAILKIVTHDAPRERRSREDNWLNYLDGIRVDNGELVPKVCAFLDAIPQALIDDHVVVVFEKLKRKISSYLEEIDEDSKKVKKHPSQESLLQLFRYVHEIPADSDLYIDHDTGFFGVSIRSKRDRLTFILKDNQEIIYSLVSSGTGISKFSGRGFIGKNKDSRKIKKIIGMTADE